MRTVGSLSTRCCAISRLLIPWAVNLYAGSPALSGAAIWWLGPGYGGIADRAQKLIDPLMRYALTLDYVIPMSGTLTPTSVPSPQGWVVYDTVNGPVSVTHLYGVPADLTGHDSATAYYVMMDTAGVQTGTVLLTVKLRPASGEGVKKNVREIRGVMYVGDTPIRMAPLSNSSTLVINAGAIQQPLPLLRRWYSDRVQNAGEQIPAYRTSTWSSPSPFL